MRVFIVAVTLMLVAASIAQQVFDNRTNVDCAKTQCGACYAVEVDFIFVIDMSSSMQDNIEAIRLGLSDFVANIAKVRSDDHDKFYAFLS